MILIPNQFEKSLIRDRINELVYYSEDRVFEDIDTELPNDVQLFVDVEVTHSMDIWGLSIIETEVCYATAVNGCNKEFKVAITWENLYPN